MLPPLSRDAVPSRVDEVDYPTAKTPVIGSARVMNPFARIALFEDDVWPLLALEDDPAREGAPLTFEGWPPGFVGFAKHVMYAYINHGTPPSLLESPSSNYARWPQALTLGGLLSDLRLLVDWFVIHWSHRHPQSHVRKPADLDPEHLNDARKFLESQTVTPRTKAKRLDAIVKVWHIGPWIPEELRWPRPEWIDSKWRPRRPHQENRNKRIQQDVMGPLLEWAIAFVTRFADDIFAAERHYQAALRELAAANPPNPGRPFLDQIVADGRALPLSPYKSSKTAVGWTAVSYHYGVPIAGLPVLYKRAYRGVISLSEHPVAASLDLKPQGQLNGVVWTEHITVFDVHRTQGPSEPGVLLGHLRTACLIICSYLMGARPEEVLRLEHGAARAPIVRPDGTVLHLVDGLVWKGLRRSADGKPPKPKKATWATIWVTTAAIAAAEEINRLLGREPGSLFTLPERRGWTGTATDWIESFVQFVNTRLAPQSSHPTGLHIPHDGTSQLSLSRFRRTLAWFLNNRPDGQVTMAIQFQQVGEVIQQGYAGTKESGMHDLMLEEDWAHRQGVLDEIRGFLEDGEQLTGRAAGRAAAAATKYPRFMTDADDRRARKDPDLVILESPSGICLCVWDEEMSLCRKLRLNGGKRAPNLLNCIPECGCRAQTPRHRELALEEVENLRAQAGLAPLPQRQAMLAEADALESRLLHATEELEPETDDDAD